MTTTSFVVTVLAAEGATTLRQIISEALAELELLGLLDSDIFQHAPNPGHPNVQKSANTRARVQKL